MNKQSMAINQHYVLYPEIQPSLRQPPTDMTTSGNKRKPLIPIHLTQRDLQMLEALYMTRYMTKDQLQSLFWREPSVSHWGPIKACERRLRQLYVHGLVRRIEQMVKYGQGHKPYIYALDRKGVEILASEIGIDFKDTDWQPKPGEENYPFLQHLLDTTDFRIALTLACEKRQVMLEAWQDEKALKQEKVRVTIVNAKGKEEQVAVIPDAQFILQRPTGGRGLFFLEIDRNTVTISSQSENRSWARKVVTYRAYIASHAYQQHYGNRQARILTVVSGGPQRLEHMKEATAKAGGDDRFWFTHFELARDSEQLLTPIWSSAGSDQQYSLFA